MRDPGATVLIVEDDAPMREALRRLLERAGMNAIEAPDGRAAIQLYYARRPDLLLLDVEIPELDGWEVLSRIREVSEDVPVLMLTGAGAELEKVRGLRAGADDYVTKPFGNQELIARVEALLRRRGSEREAEPAVHQDALVRIDQLQRRVEVLGTPVELTPTEFRLLWALVQNSDRVLSPSQLLDLAWGDDFGDPQRVKLYIGYLRRKLIAAGSVNPIETVRGFGYRYRPRRAN
jgi:DNA-binding response OmpR family regulator